MIGVKFHFTDEQIVWLKENFADTLNKDICEHLECGETTLRLLARSLGLRKSKAHLDRRQDKARDGLRRYYITHKPTYNVDHIKPYQFKAGNDPRTFKGFWEGIENMKETRRQMIREEKARIAFGLPQKTALRLKRQPRPLVWQRSYLKACGYILDEGKRVAYWTEGTKRALILEARKGKHNFYTFKEYGLAVH